MKYMTVLEASRKWGISDRRVRFLCSQGRIRGIIQQGRRYLIPYGTEKPADERIRQRHSSRTKHYNDFSRIDFLKGMIADQPDVSGTVREQRSRDFMLNFATSNAQLSGNSLSREEIQKIFEGRVSADCSLNDLLSVVGTRDAMNYVKDCVLEKKPLSQNIIRSIHGLLMVSMPDEKGKYRRVKVMIQGAENDPVWLDLMEPRMNDLLNINTQRKKVMHPVERIARFHLEFMNIHPFSDGNGRTGRILMNLELMQNGYPPIEIRMDQKKEYEAAIRTYYSKHDAEPMVRLISDNLEESLEKQLRAAYPRRKRKAAEPKTELKSEPKPELKSETKKEFRSKAGISLPAMQTVYPETRI